ncbi:MAG: hypothetical protein P8R43_01600, partial [Planctomycetota bacterium]|nr:hypothetical protein [Planctomycetota bacterium]
MLALLVTVLSPLMTGWPAAPPRPSAVLAPLEGATPAPPKGAAADRKGESEKALQAGRQALERGELEQAAGHFERAAAG